MALRFTLREAPRVPLEAEVLCPDRLSGLARREIETLAVWHGNERCRLGEFFTVAGQGTENVRVEGDLGRVKFIGSAMTGGRLSVSGSVGMHVGARMRGGEILVEGDADDWAGAEMRGGLIAIRGTAGHRLGGAYPGQRTGMRGGEIVVGGDAGSEAGAGLRRGLIAIGGRAGADTGLRMLAGTIVAFGGVGRRPGVGLRRG
jgi:formylmethanofuran dehydrogenase subunit C